MLTFKKLEQAGHDNNGNLALAFLSTDNKRYEMAIKKECLAHSIGMMLKATAGLSAPNAAQVEGAAVQGELSLAIGPQMTAALVMRFGPVGLTLHLSEIQLTSLFEDIGRHLAEMQKPKH